MEKFTVQVDKDLEDIVPNFMKNRNKDIIELRELLAANDYSSIEKIAHKVAGSSGGYGFNELGKIAKEIEKKAMASETDSIPSLVKSFQEYVENVQIEFVEMDD